MMFNLILRQVFRLVLNPSWCCEHLSTYLVLYADYLKFIKCRIRINESMIESLCLSPKNGVEQVKWRMINHSSLGAHTTLGKEHGTWTFSKCKGPHPSIYRLHDHLQVDAKVAYQNGLTILPMCESSRFLHNIIQLILILLPSIQI